MNEEWVITQTLSRGTVHESVIMHFYHTEKAAREDYDLCRHHDSTVRLCRIIERNGK